MRGRRSEMAAVPIEVIIWRHPSQGIDQVGHHQQTAIGSH